MASYIMLKMKEIFVLNFGTQKSKPFPKDVTEGDNQHRQRPIQILPTMLLMVPFCNFLEK